MAIVGEQLTAPEAGWKRLDDTDPKIKYSSNVSWIRGTSFAYYYGETVTYVQGNAGFIQFKFFGTKLRIIGDKNWGRVNADDGYKVIIDGVEYYTINQYNPTALYQILLFEKVGLDNKIHDVTICAGPSFTDNNCYIELDAVDIDDTGYLVEPVDGHALLRITMADSSEREYKLAQDEIDNFINWFDRTIGTGNTCYVFNKDIQSSKEYLSFEKILSFEVIPLEQ